MSNKKPKLEICSPTVIDEEGVIDLSMNRKYSNIFRDVRCDVKNLEDQHFTARNPVYCTRGTDEHPDDRKLTKDVDSSSDEAVGIRKPKVPRLDTNEPLRGAETMKSLRPTRAMQIEAIEESFAQAKIPIVEHYNKPGVVPVEVMEVFPDFKLWGNRNLHTIFKKSPAPKSNSFELQDEKVTQAIIRGVEDNNEKMVAYFLPTKETLAKRKQDLANNVAYNEAEVYDYKLKRQYDWKHVDLAEKRKQYYLIERDNAVYYNELKHAVKLKTRRTPGGLPKKTSLRVRHVPMDDTEEACQQLKKMELEPKMKRASQTTSVVSDDEIAEFDLVDEEGAVIIVPPPIEFQ